MVKSAQSGEGGGATLPLSPSQARLRCTLQLRGQIHSHYLSSTPICTLWTQHPIFLYVTAHFLCQSRQMYTAYKQYIKMWLYVCNILLCRIDIYTGNPHLFAGFPRFSPSKYCRCVGKCTTPWRKNPRERINGYVVIKYLTTSGFWPRVRARALRALVFLGSLPRQTGRCAPPPLLLYYRLAY